MSGAGSSERYNAVAPVYGAPAGSSVESGAEAGGPPLSEAAGRLAAIKSLLADARKSNHKEVVDEDRRNKLGPEALKKERSEKEWGKRVEAGSIESEADKLMSATAADAQDRQHKKDKNGKWQRYYGWDVFNNEAQHRHYKKHIVRAGKDGRVGVEGGEGGEGGGGDGDEEEYDPLDYGRAPPVAKERVQALVDDMHETALRRTEWSRRRTYDESQDVTYINKRNEVFNKKIARAFDPYTSDIKANLERGTAL